MAQTKKKKPAAKSKTAKTSAAKPGKKSSPVKKLVKKLIKLATPAKKASAPARVTALPMKKNSSATLPAKKASALIPNSFKPLDDRIIISLEPAAEKTAGGLYIPGTASERPSRGTVLAKGPGRRNKKGVLRPLDVSVGDMVIFPQFAGQKIEIGTGEFLILREEEILGITSA